MRYQAKNFSCGPASIVNALRVLGKKVTEASLRTACGTTPENGTDEDGIKAGLDSIGFGYYEFQTPNRKDGLLWLSGSLSEGPVIACVKSWSHWVCIAGKTGDRFIIIDPSNAKNNKKENGVLTLSSKELLKQWRHEKEGLVYGLLVKKK